MAWVLPQPRESWSSGVGVSTLESAGPGEWASTRPPRFQTVEFFQDSKGFVTDETNSGDVGLKLM